MSRAAIYNGGLFLFFPIINCRITVLTTESQSLGICRELRGKVESWTASPETLFELSADLRRPSTPNKFPGGSESFRAC